MDMEQTKKKLAEIQRDYVVEATQNPDAETVEALGALNAGFTTNATVAMFGMDSQAYMKYRVQELVDDMDDRDLRRNLVDCLIEIERLSRFERIYKGSWTPSDPVQEVR